MSKRNFKLNVRVKVDDELERSILSVFDTGAGPSLISKDAASEMVISVRCSDSGTF